MVQNADFCRKTNMKIMCKGMKTGRKACFLACIFARMGYFGERVL